MVPALGGEWIAPGFLQEYRGQAWEAFERLPMPTTSDEAWRRTDLRAMQAGAFRLPQDGSLKAMKMPEAPK